MATQWTELEKTSNKVTSFSSTTSDNKYPSEKLVKSNLDKCEKSSNKKKAWSSTLSDTNYPTEKLVKTSIDQLNTDLTAYIDDAKTELINSIATTKQALNNSINTLTTNLTNGNTVVAKATKATSADTATKATTADSATHATTADSATTATNATNATNAAKATTATSATNATKVNNLELKRDSNGVLKIGSIIIPQKKLVMDTAVRVKPTDDTTYTVIYTDPTVTEIVNKTYEIVYSTGYNARKHIKISIPDSGGSIIYEFARYSGSENGVEKFMVFTIASGNFSSGNDGLNDNQLGIRVQLSYETTSTSQQIVIHEIYEIIE